MITLKRVYSLDLWTVSEMLKAYKHAPDGVNLFVTLREALHDHEKWAILRAWDDDKPIGVAVFELHPPVATFWLLSAKGFLTWHSPEVEGVLANWLRSVGCSEVKCYGRPGWLAKRPPGWKVTRVEFGKVL